MASALRNSIRVARAVGTNQVARIFPWVYVRLTGQTGRGDRSGETPEAVADYFVRCFGEYFEILSIPRNGIGAYIAGKTVLEYGPGDLPGVALLMLAHGAERVICIDRFPLVRFPPFARATLEDLLGRLSGSSAERARRALRDPSDVSRGFVGERLEYRVDRDGLSGLRESVDFVISRAVLEHVNDLSATFRDIAAALRPGGVAVHLVDLKSHGLHQSNLLDFLTWPEWLWNLMYSAKGVPNRWRVNRYREEVKRAGLELQLLQSTGSFSADEVAAVRPKLAGAFREVSDDELVMKGFWLICRKPG